MSQPPYEVLISEIPSPISFAHTIGETAIKQFKLESQLATPLQSLIRETFLDNVGVGSLTVEMARPNSIPYQLFALQKKLNLDDNDFSKYLSSCLVISYDIDNLKKINESEDGSYPAGTQDVLLHYQSVLDLEKSETLLILEKPMGDEGLLIIGPKDGNIANPEEVIADVGQRVTALIKNLKPDDPLIAIIEKNHQSWIAKSFAHLPLSKIDINAKQHIRGDDISDMLMDNVERPPVSSPRAPSTIIDQLLLQKDHIFFADERSLEGVDTRLKNLKKYLSDDLLKSFEQLSATPAWESRQYQSFVTRIFEERLFNSQFSRDLPVLNEDIWKQQARFDNFAMLSPHFVKDINKHDGRLAGTKELQDVLRSLKVNLPNTFTDPIENHLHITKIGASFYLNYSSDIAPLLESFSESDNFTLTPYGEYAPIYVDSVQGEDQNRWQFLDKLRLQHYYHEKIYAKDRLTQEGDQAFFARYIGERPQLRTQQLSQDRLMSPFETAIFADPMIDLDFSSARLIKNLLELFRQNLADLTNTVRQHQL